MLAKILTALAGLCFVASAVTHTPAFIMATFVLTMGDWAALIAEGCRPSEEDDPLEGVKPGLHF